jgi:hypothetical protein
VRWDLVFRLEVLEYYAGGDVEYLGDVEEPFVEQPALAKFYLDDQAAVDARGKCNFLLSQSTLEAKCSDAGADRQPCGPPSCGTVGIVLAGACRHAPQSSGGRGQSL